MLTQPDQFPPDRRADPRRRAEARVFDAIQSSDRSGLAIYEWQRNPASPQLDFAIWTQGGGRFGLQVKGGQHLTGEWQVVPRNPRRPRGEALTPVRDLGRRHVPPGGHHRCPGGHLLLRHRGAPVSRHGARPGHCRRGQAQQRPRPLGHGQPDEPAWRRSPPGRPTTRPTPTTSVVRSPRSPTGRSCTPRRARTRANGKSGCSSLRFPGWKSRPPASPSATWTP